MSQVNTPQKNVMINPDDAVMLLIEHQSGLFQLVKDIPVPELRRNAIAPARLAPWRCAQSNASRAAVGARTEIGRCVRTRRRGWMGSLNQGWVRATARNPPIDKHRLSL